MLEHLGIYETWDTFRGKALKPKYTHSKETKYSNEGNCVYINMCVMYGSCMQGRVWIHLLITYFCYKIDLWRKKSEAYGILLFEPIASQFL